MKRLDWIGAAWLLVLLLGVAAVGGSSRTPDTLEPSGPQNGALPLPVATTARGSVRDASGHLIPIHAYRKIASASGLADELLVELAEPERIYAFSHHGMSEHPERHRFGARAEVSGPADLERLLQNGVDLLVVNHLGAEQELERVRASGIAVFDLGEMRGLRTLQANILTLAELLGDRSRGERLWQRFERRMRAVASDIPRDRRKQALYLAVYAGKIFGGTLGTSYHDVLEAAGLIDLAASRYRDWPQYDPEQLLTLDPPLIVTEQGMAHELCMNRWLSGLRACREPAERILEQPGALLGDPGLSMLDAAERLRDAAYGVVAR